MVGILLTFVLLRKPEPVHVIGRTLNSLNAEVSCRKYGGRSNLGEQIRQVRDPPTIELLHRFDEPASEILIREWLTQPMKFLRGPVPRHRIGQTSLVAQLFFHENPLVFSEDPRIPHKHHHHHHEAHHHHHHTGPQP